MLNNNPKKASNAIVEALNDELELDVAGNFDHGMQGFINKNDLTQPQYDAAVRDNFLTHAKLWPLIAHYPSALHLFG